MNALYKTTVFTALALAGLSAAVPLKKHENNLPAPFGGVHSGQGQDSEVNQDQLS